MTRLKLTLTTLLTATLVVASLPLQAFAQSPAGHPLQVTNHLKIARPGTEPEDVTTTYGVKMFAKKDNWNNPKLFDQVKASNRRALENGVWALVQYSEPDGSYQSLKYYWIEDSTDLTTISASVGSNYTIYNFVAPSGKCFHEAELLGDGKVGLSFSGGSSQPRCLGAFQVQSNKEKLFLFSGETKLDKSAQGLVGDIPQTAPTGDTILRVNFKYSHVFTDIRARYTGLTRHKSGVSADNIPDPAKIRWYLIKHFDSAKDDPETWNQAALASWSKLDDYNNSDYALRTGDTIPALRVEDLMSGDSRPPMYVCSAVTSASDEFTTDACNYRPYNPSGTARKDIKHEKYVLTAIPHEGAYSPEHNVIFRYTLAKLDLSTSVEAAFTDSCNAIRDGSNGNDRECKEYSDYQDCSLLDVLDVVGRIGCHISNFGVALKNMIKFLFVPNPLSVSDSFNSMLENMKRSFGFLSLPITLIPNLFNMVNQGANIGSNCELPPITVFGASASIQLCGWRHQLPEVWRFMQLIIQAGIALAFIWVLYSLFMRAFGIHIKEHSPDDDAGVQEVRWLDERTGEVGDWMRRRK